MLMAALSCAQAAWADFGSAPGWSPDWGPQPITPPAISGINTKSVSPAIADNAVRVAFPGNVGQSPWAEGLQCPMPLAGTPADYATARAVAAQVPQPIIPSIPLVETPHDRSMRAIEVPNGGTVLMDGTIIAGGKATGSSDMGTFFQPPDPPALPEDWANIGRTVNGIPSFNAPILP